MVENFVSKGNFPSVESVGESSYLFKKDFSFAYPYLFENTKRLFRILENPLFNSWSKLYRNVRLSVTEFFGRYANFNAKLVLIIQKKLKMACRYIYKRKDSLFEEYATLVK